VDEAMKEICAVFTYQRDELLYLCLEAIRSQDRELHIMVFSDRGHYTPDLVETCRKFNTSYVVRKKAVGYGNSFNVIEGLRWCCGMGCDVVHAIEDDTIIHAGYLEWARMKVFNNPVQYAVALGRIPSDIESTWFESPCVTWNAKCLEMCLEKIPLNYFSETIEGMQKAVDAAFPHSKFCFGSAQQDGFFLRCLEFFKFRTAYPGTSFASHLGTYGYNRPGGLKPDGTLDERVAFFRKLLYDKTRRTEQFGQEITEREMRGLNA
jgi:hypothetical protein